MEKENIPTLKIDPDFKDLIAPPQRQEYLQLEENILQDGCRDPIIVWNGTIIDGHNRYEICCRHNIPFSVVEKKFSSKEEAIAWICSNQLGRRNISEETRKFLIGKQYEARRITSIKKAQESSSSASSVPRTPTGQFGKMQDSRHMTAEAIAIENNVSPGTVQKYAVYSKALEQITQKVPMLGEKILSGQYKISHDNVVLLSTKTPRELRRIEKKLAATTGAFVQYKHTRPVISDSQQNGGPAKYFHTTVKDMPKFDPNAAITSLYLTIPSWTNTIERAINEKVIEGTSDTAQQDLKNALAHLIESVDKLLGEIEEK